MKTPPLALCAALLLAGVAPRAFAASANVLGMSPTDPVEQQGIANSPAAFTITSDYQSSLIRFDRPTGNAICNHISHGVDAAPPVPLDIAWDGGHATLNPGECLHVDAPSARIAPAAPMSSDEMLQGM